MAGSFLKQHRRGKPGSVARIKRRGIGTKLVLRYDPSGQLAELSVGSDANGLRLYFDWVNDLHALKTPRGLGGRQWSGGTVATGTVYDDTAGGDDLPSELDDWIEDCISTMVDVAR